MRALHFEAMDAFIFPKELVSQLAGAQPPLLIDVHPFTDFRGQSARRQSA